MVSEVPNLKITNNLKVKYYHLYIHTLLKCAVLLLTENLQLLCTQTQLKVHFPNVIHFAKILTNATSNQTVRFATKS